MVELPDQGSAALFSWLRAAMTVAVIRVHSNACFGNPLEDCRQFRIALVRACIMQ